MGATSWRYYTPYQPDPETALQSLRGEVFARGEYVDPTGPLEDTLRQTARRFGQDETSPEVQDMIQNAAAIQRAVQSGDTHGLSRADRTLVKRLRAIGKLATRFGAGPPAASGGAPGSITELLERAAECGTHSILDIEQTATRPRFGAADPMTGAALRRVFRTTEPTHEQVEAHWPGIAESLGQWQARYLVVYRDGQPQEYAFIGCSGD